MWGACAKWISVVYLYVFWNVIAGTGFLWNEVKTPCTIIKTYFSYGLTCAARWADSYFIVTVRNEDMSYNPVTHVAYSFPSNHLSFPLLQIILQCHFKDIWQSCFLRQFTTYRQMCHTKPRHWYTSGRGSAPLRRQPKKCLRTTTVVVDWRYNVGSCAPSDL